MNPWLTTITISDFRSVSGTVTVPLDSPVVLVHGPNGSGKTSILSAVELALTGQLNAMRRTDPYYKQHLVHRGKPSGTITITTKGTTRLTTTINVSQGRVQGEPQLEGDLSRFFSERCYLAQATLGRLLELYQFAPEGNDSPLTRFVKDLLGLYELDALQDGLHAAADIRNLRKIVPRYANAEEDKRQLQANVKAEVDRINALSAQCGARHQQLVGIVRQLNGDPEALLTDDEAARAFFSLDSEEHELVALVGTKRELLNLRERVEALSHLPSGIANAAAAAAHQQARRELDEWLENIGEPLDSVIARLRQVFPDLPSMAATDPKAAFSTASDRLNAELERCTQAIAGDDRLAQQATDEGQKVEHARSRLALIDEGLRGITANPETLSKLLAALLPHIKGEDCPVCGRDYSEVSQTPLANEVSTRVSHFAGEAAQLRSLSKARLETTADLSRSERALASATSERLNPEARVLLQARVATLTEFKQQLLAMSSQIEDGVLLFQKEATTREQHATVIAGSLELQQVMRRLAEINITFLGTAPAFSQSAEHILDRLNEHVLARQETLTVRQKARRNGLEQLAVMQDQRAQLARAEASEVQLRSRLERLDQALRSADQRRSAVRELSRMVADTRAHTVALVFNDALNKLWRDLFVRLAPGEPFVPAFVVPEHATQRIAARLETLHRHGGRGGTPGAMLSSGNLNTAALTLFLALHLSVAVDLPWLVLDDPIQSMDEVHIAQFAALLRTLSKEHHRQIVIAVHDKSLFDYLALELSPAFAGDRLITVELSRAPDSDTLAKVSFHTWKPDAVLAA